MAASENWITLTGTRKSRFGIPMLVLVPSPKNKGRPTLKVGQRSSTFVPRAEA